VRGRNLLSFERDGEATDLCDFGGGDKIANVPSPIGAETIKATLSGIRRSIGAAPVRKKAATSDIVLGMAGTVGGESLRQLRDRAILLIGFASAMRRSELVALNLSDLEWTSEACSTSGAVPAQSPASRSLATTLPEGALARGLLPPNSRLQSKH
jgi:integrase